MREYDTIDSNSHHIIVNTNADPIELKVNSELIRSNIDGQNVKWHAILTTSYEDMYIEADFEVTIQSFQDKAFLKRQIAEHIDVDLDTASKLHAKWIHVIANIEDAFFKEAADMLANTLGAYLNDDNRAILIIDPDTNDEYIASLVYDNDRNYHYNGVKYNVSAVVFQKEDGPTHAHLYTRVNHIDFYARIRVLPSSKDSVESVRQSIDTVLKIERSHVADRAIDQSERQLYQNIIELFTTTLTTAVRTIEELK